MDDQIREFPPLANLDCRSAVCRCNHLRYLAVSISDKECRSTCCQNAIEFAWYDAVLKPGNKRHDMGVGCAQTFGDVFGRLERFEKKILKVAIANHFFHMCPLLTSANQEELNVIVVAQENRCLKQR